MTTLRVRRSLRISINNVRVWPDVDIAMMVQITYNKLLHADKLLAALAIYR
jgi:hypothetical protein